MEYIQPKEATEAASKLNSLSTNLNYLLALIVGLVGGYMIHGAVYSFTNQDQAAVVTTEEVVLDVSQPVSVDTSIGEVEEGGKMFGITKPYSASGKIKSVGLDYIIIEVNVENASEEKKILLGENVTIMRLITDCGKPIAAMCGSEVIAQKDLNVGDTAIAMLLEGIEPPTAASIQVLAK